jgi:hypothetical protein
MYSCTHPWNTINYSHTFSWDNDSSIPRPEWVSPWQIEPVVRPSPINLLPLSRPKRLHPNALAFLPDSSNSSKEGLSLPSLIDVELVE